MPFYAAIYIYVYHHVFIGEFSTVMIKAKKNIPVALSAAPDSCEDYNFLNLIYCGKNNLFLL